MLRCGLLAKITSGRTEPFRLTPGTPYNEGQGFEDIVPRGKNQIGGQADETAEELHAPARFRSGQLPQRLDMIADGVTGEGKEIEDGEAGREILFAVAEVVLEVVALGLQHIGSAVLYHPSGAATRSLFGDVVWIHWQIGDQAVT
jgi:hypothetical protein